MKFVRESSLPGAVADAEDDRKSVPTLTASPTYDDSYISVSAGPDIRT